MSATVEQSKKERIVDLFQLWRDRHCGNCPAGFGSPVICGASATGRRVGHGLLRYVPADRPGTEYLFEVLPGCPAIRLCRFCVSVRSKGLTVSMTTLNGLAIGKATHCATVLALTGKNRARWSGKPEESAIFARVACCSLKGGPNVHTNTSTNIQHPDRTLS